MQNPFGMLPWAGPLLQPPLQPFPPPRINCWESRPPTDPPLPKLSDCAHIIAHIPTIPFTPNNAFAALSLASDSSPRLSRSAPFLPPASFHHDTCIIIIQYHAGHPPPDISDLNGRQPVETAFAPAGVSRVLDVGRQTAEQVMIHCVKAKGHEGTIWGPLEIEGMEDMWYEVEVLADKNQWAFPDANLVRATREALDGEEGTRVHNIFAEAFYEM